MPTPTLHVRIISPQQLLLDTQAESVSSKNSQGKFDILPQHANFITVVENEPIIVRMPKDKNKQKPLVLQLPIAIIYNTNNQVNIYTYLTSTPSPKK